MQFKKKLIPALVFGVVVGGGLVGSVNAYADDNADLEALRAQIDELSQKIKVLDRKNEIADEEAAAKKKDSPVIKASADGFGIQSADGNFKLNLKGQFQANGRSYISGVNSGNSTAQQNTPDTYFLRQVRPILSGTLFKDYDFLFVPDFGQGKTVIQDAYINAKLQPWFQIEAGKQKTPFGLERLQADADGAFIERGLTNDLVPNRDIGAQIHGGFANNNFTYALGYFNGVADSSSSDSYTSPDFDNNDNKSYVARVFATPFKDEPGFLQGLGAGFAVTYADFIGSGTGTNATTAQSISQSNLPTYKSALGQLSVFSYRTAAAGATTGTFANGTQVRWSPQAYYYNGPFGLFGEYVRVDQDVSRNVPGFNRTDSLSNDAWQVVGSWVITGEDEGYSHPVPKRNFDLSSGGWGAWEAVARFSQLDIDNKAFSPFGGGTAAAQQGRSYADPTTAISKASAWAVGVNWYLNNNVKVYLDYEQTAYNGGWSNGAGTVLDRPDDRVLETQLQLTF
ncbi:MAG TPA: porin [Methylophilaceae bacterium]